MQSISRRGHGSGGFSFSGFVLSDIAADDDRRAPKFETELRHARLVKQGIVGDLNKRVAEANAQPPGAKLQREQIRPAQCAAALGATRLADHIVSCRPIYSAGLRANAPNTPLGLSIIKDEILGQHEYAVLYAPVQSDGKASTDAPGEILEQPLAARTPE